MLGGYYSRDSIRLILLSGYYSVVTIQWLLLGYNPVNGWLGLAPHPIWAYELQVARLTTTRTYLKNWTMRSKELDVHSEKKFVLKKPNPNIRLFSIDLRLLLQRAHSPALFLTFSPTFISIQKSPFEILPKIFLELFHFNKTFQWIFTFLPPKSLTEKVSLKNFWLKSDWNLQLKSIIELG